MKGETAFTSLIAIAAVPIAGCGVGAAQEGTSGEATTTEGGVRPPGLPSGGGRSRPGYLRV